MEETDKNKHKNKHGLVSFVILLLGVIGALYFENKDVIGISGAFMIIVATGIWRDDHKKVSINKHKKLENLNSELQAKIKSLTTKPEDDPSHIINLSNDISATISSETLKYLRRYNTDDELNLKLQKNINEEVFNLADLVRKLSETITIENRTIYTHMRLTQSVIKDSALVNDQSEETKDFINKVELTLVGIGTIFWALGNYFYEVLIFWIR